MSKESKALDEQVAELTGMFDERISKHRSDPTAASLAAAIVAARQCLRADGTKADFLELCDGAWKLAEG